MRKKENKSSTTLKEKRTKALKRLHRLRESAERVQQEINTITEELENLNQEIEEESSSDNSSNTAIESGDRVEYNKKAGKRLRKGNTRNPRGTVIRVTEHYIYIRADDTGHPINRAHFNVNKI